MRQTPLFNGISQDSINAMVSCFRPETRLFRRGETILVFSSELEYLCVLLSGSAHLYCTDSEGEYTLLKQLEVSGRERPVTVAYPTFSTTFNQIIYGLKEGNVTDLLNAATNTLQSEMDKLKNRK